MDNSAETGSYEREIVSSDERRVKLKEELQKGLERAKEHEAEQDVDFDDIVILESDETSWVLIGDIWVDTSRIISVGPLYEVVLDANDRTVERQITDDDGKPVMIGTVVQIESPHNDSQFIHAEGVSVEEIMGRILDATTDDDKDEDDDK